MHRHKTHRCIPPIFQNGGMSLIHSSWHTPRCCVSLPLSNGNTALIRRGYARMISIVSRVSTQNLVLYRHAEPYQILLPPVELTGAKGILSSYLPLTQRGPRDDRRRLTGIHPRCLRSSLSLPVNSSVRPSLSSRSVNGS
jgi:hypothetical protein